jgi:uncharacterized protein YciI
MTMFVVLLRFDEHRAKARELMDAHNAWIQRGFDDRVFLLTGSLRPDLGGVIFAIAATRFEIEERVSGDPFVCERVVSAEIVEIAPSRVDARLAFLR